MTVPKTLDEWEPRPAERRLATGMGVGQIVIIGNGLPPDPPPPDRVIRATFLRALILGQIADCPVPETGVRVQGAHIEGDGPVRAETRGLDLESCDLVQDLVLFYCRLPDMLLLRSASLRNLFLGASRLGAGVSADRLEAKGSVLARSIEMKGEMRLLGAKLGGDLDCSEARLTAGPEGMALSADRIEVRGGVFMRNLAAQGVVRLPGARLGGRLDCNRAEITALEGSGHALFTFGIDVRGDVVLVESKIKGATVFAGAKIAGSIDLTGAKLEENGAAAFNFHGGQVDGRLVWKEGATAKGPFLLTSSKIGQIEDDSSCWPEPGCLALNLCRYDAFSGNTAPLDARSRIEWLSLQDEQEWGEDFWPQPWEECARVLRAMGHGEDARKILIEKEKRQRAARRARLRAMHLYEDADWFAIWDRLLGVTVRYGRMPLLAFVWLAGVWVLGWGIFAYAFEAQAFKPGSALVLRAPEWVACDPNYAAGASGVARYAGQESQLACFREQPEAAAYPAFHAGMYAADTLVPVVSFGVAEYWVPDERHAALGWVRGYLWLHIALGWGLSLLAVAGFSGLIRTDNT